MRLSDAILASPRRVALPVLTYPGGQLTGATVSELVHDPAKQVAAQVALHERFRTEAFQSSMDLSVEAEEFGAAIQFADEEVPAVVGRLVLDAEGVSALPVPPAGNRRSGVFLKTVEALKRGAGGMPVIGGCIGPFSLAGRLFGVSEALMATAAEPETVLALVEKSAAYLTGYVTRFRDAGADAVMMAEPTAGLMSPASVATFSSPFVLAIREAVETSDFQVILHNCGARMHHLQAKLASGAQVLHFGRPMDLVAAIDAVPGDVVIGGNLDPAEVFLKGNPRSVAAATSSLLSALSGKRNIFISSGCDIPYAAPLENLEAFFNVLHH
jgi:uroporphyrinogen decarboxylase